jgi:uncharacterized protein (DUF1684 family)
MDGATSIEPTWLDLHDWRIRVARLYRERDEAHRAAGDPAAVLARFRAAKNALFAGHPQSPLAPEARAAFRGLDYFAYDPALRVEAALASLPPDPTGTGDTVEAPSSGPHAMPLVRAAEATFALVGQPQRLTVFWIDVYGGGLFLPFRDATCPAESYGAGRYLFDTVKGSTFEPLDAGEPDAGHMGYADSRIILDFNYAYNPSCAYDARWVCPLAPRENWLTVPIRAGERKYDH